MTETNLKFALSCEDLLKFHASGIAGPFRLLPDHEVKPVLRKLSIAKAKLFFWHRILSRSLLLRNFFAHARWGKATWHKGMHLISPVAYSLSTNEVILDKIQSILGPNLVQWGADFISQKPGRLHRWHVDADCLHCEGLTVWLALDNLNEMTAMKVISGSHRLQVHPAQLSSSCGLDTSDDDAVLKSARELDSTCELKTLTAKPGEFFIFFGQVWHSIENRSQRRRSAITFQYSPTRAKVKMPAAGYQFPFVWDSRPVPCCLVRGVDEYGRNLLVNGPLAKAIRASD
jgi:hypothetical protein